jgi:hypothetical protein
MGAYLTKTVETYRVANEKEANAMIKAAQEDKTFELKKYNSEYRIAKKNGEIIDSWYRVTLTKEFNEEKEPVALVNVEYSRSEGYFPSPVENLLSENSNAEEYNDDEEDNE